MDALLADRPGAQVELIDGARSPLARLVTLPSTGSTNSDLLAELAPSGSLRLDARELWPQGSVLWARRQTHGRGRGERRWESAGESSLTASIVVYPTVPVEKIGWVPLLAGLAIRRCLKRALQAASVPWEAWIKWPNDVVLHPHDAPCRCPRESAARPTNPAGLSELPDAAPTHQCSEPIEGWGRFRKVAGILVETVWVQSAAANTQTGRSAWPCSSVAIIGLGLNTNQSACDLPVPWAISLAQLGLVDDQRSLLLEIWAELEEILDIWEKGQSQEVGMSAAGQARELEDEIRAACMTLGRRVHAEFSDPASKKARQQLEETGTAILCGTAMDVRPELILETGSGTFAIPAGDVTIREDIR